MDKTFTSLIVEDIQKGEMHIGMTIPIIFELKMSNSEKCDLYQEIEENLIKINNTKRINELHAYLNRLDCK